MNVVVPASYNESYLRVLAVDGEGAADGCVGHGQVEEQASVIAITRFRPQERT